MFGGHFYGDQGKMRQDILGTYFLHSCCQHVAIKGILSSSFPVKARVPQGSVLGPILFLIFINNVRLWKILFFMMDGGVFGKTGRQPAGSSLSAHLIEPEAGQTLGMSSYSDISLPLAKRTVWQTLPSIFLTILLRKFSHSNSWISLSARIFLGQTTFQCWPPKPAADWASCIGESPSLAHLLSEPDCSQYLDIQSRTTISQCLPSQAICIYSITESYFLTLFVFCILV